MSGKHRNKRLAKQYPPGAIIRFGWNHLFGEPSCVMEIQSMVEMDGSELVVPVPIQTGPLKKDVARLKLTELIDAIEYFAPDVIPITKVMGDIQIPMFC